MTTRKHVSGARIAALLATAAGSGVSLRNDLSAEGQELVKLLDTQTGALKNLAEDAVKQAKANRELTDTLRASVDTALTNQAALTAQVTDIHQKLAAQTPAGQARAQTLGQMFTADADVARYLEAAGRGVFGKAGVSAVLASGLHNAVTSDPASAGALKTPQYVPGIIPPGLQQLRIRDLLMWGTTTQAAIQYFKELAFTNNAAPVTENVLKPESGITFAADTASVITIAHFIKCSRQVLADVPQLESYIDGRLRYGLKLKEEAQLLNGSGVGNNLNGLYTGASDYSNPGVTVDTENRMDRLRLAILQAELTGYYVDGLVLSPIDWTSIELLKTASDKNYLVGNPFGGIQPMLWGRPVVASQSMSAGNYLVGAFGMAAQGWDREQMTVQIGYDGDDFTNNRLTLLCEERLALTIYRADALVKGSFGSVV